MPGLTGRIVTFIKAKISKLLVRAEDPTETLDYAYERQLENLQDVKKGIADVVTAKKRLQQQEEALRGQAAKLDGQARQAMSAGKEVLARTALERKHLIQGGGAVARSAGVRVRVRATEADRLRAAAALADRGVPLQEGSDQGAVLGGRGAGSDLRGGHGSRG
jgi:phage shock protein A